MSKKLKHVEMVLEIVSTIYHKQKVKKEKNQNKEHTEALNFKLTINKRNVLDISFFSGSYLPIYHRKVTVLSQVNIPFTLCRYCISTVAQPNLNSRSRNYSTLIPILVLYSKSSGKYLVCFSFKILHFTALIKISILGKIGFRLLSNLGNEERIGLGNTRILIIVI